jgi:hypothetical protein
MSNEFFDSLLEAARQRDCGVADVACWLKAYRTEATPVEVVAEARELARGLTNDEISEILPQAEALSSGTTVYSWQFLSKQDNTIKSFIPEHSLRYSTECDPTQNFQLVVRLQSARRSFEDSLRRFAKHDLVPVSEALLQSSVFKQLLAASLAIIKKFE